MMISKWSAADGSSNHELYTCSRSEPVKTLLRTYLTLLDVLYLPRRRLVCSEVGTYLGIHYLSK